MKKFNELSKEKVNVVEKRILDSWKKNDIFNKTIENRKNNENFGKKREGWTVPALLTRKKHKALYYDKAIRTG